MYEKNTIEFYKELNSICDPEKLLEIERHGIYLYEPLFKYEKIKNHVNIVEISILAGQYFMINNDEQFEKFDEILSDDDLFYELIKNISIPYYIDTEIDCLKLIIPNEYFINKYLFEGVMYDSEFKIRYSRINQEWKYHSFNGNICKSKESKMNNQFRFYFIYVKEYFLYYMTDNPVIKNNYIQILYKDIDKFEIYNNENTNYNYINFLLSNNNNIQKFNLANYNESYESILYYDSDEEFYEISVNYKIFPFDRCIVGYEKLEFLIRDQFDSFKKRIFNNNDIMQEILNNIESLLIYNYINEYKYNFIFDSLLKILYIISLIHNNYSTFTILVLLRHIGGHNIKYENNCLYFIKNKFQFLKKTFKMRVRLIFTFFLFIIKIYCSGHNHQDLQVALTILSASDINDDCLAKSNCEPKLDKNGNLLEIDNTKDLYDSKFSGETVDDYKINKDLLKYLIKDFSLFNDETDIFLNPIKDTGNYAEVNKVLLGVIESISSNNNNYGHFFNANYYFGSNNVNAISDPSDIEFSYLN
eukprot:jgi/Orpsp1_1/1189175/evm.model.d7180000070019.1